MDDITTRTVIIAVNIFVTITIVTLIILSFFKLQDIYGLVRKTDTSIYNTFDNVYSKYNGKVVSGIGLLNALKSQEDSNEAIVISYTGSNIITEELSKINANKNDDVKQRESAYLKQLMEEGKEYNYEDKYKGTVHENDDGKIVVDFERITKIAK